MKAHVSPREEIKVRKDKLVRGFNRVPPVPQKNRRIEGLTQFAFSEFKPDPMFRSSDPADHFRNIGLLVSFELVRNRETFEITDQAVS